MSHILKKLQVAGAKKKKKPQPPVYLPPVMGELQYGASHSYAETIDLISDGPIAGLVGPEGDLLEGLNILKGIYFEDTAVAIDNEGANNTLSQQGAEQNARELASGTGTGIRALKEFCKALTRQIDLSQDGLISTLNHNGVGGEPNNYESQMRVEWADANWTPWHTLNMIFQKIRVGDENPEEAPDHLESSLYIRAYLESSSGVRFYWYLDGELNYGGDGDSQVDAAFRNDRFPRGLWNGEDGEGVRPQSMYWTDQNTLASSKFFCGFTPKERNSAENPIGWMGGFSRTLDDAENFVRSELTEILALWNDNNSPDGLNPEANNFQKTLAAKALTNLGWGAEGNQNIAGLLSNWVKEQTTEWLNLGFTFIVKVEEDNPNIVGRNILDEDGSNVLDMTTMVVGADPLVVGSGWAMDGWLNGIPIDWMIGTLARMSYGRKLDITCPEIDSLGNLTGKMHGFIVFTLPMQNAIFSGEGVESKIVSFHRQTVQHMTDINTLQYTTTVGFGQDWRNGIPNVTETEVSSNLKFNYTNVLAEFKQGTEDQTPLKAFRRVFIDHVYNKELFGPFTTRPAGLGPAAAINRRAAGAQGNAPQRINAGSDSLTRSEVLALGAANFNLQIDPSTNLPLMEGSDDERYAGDNDARTFNYSKWAEGSLVNWDEKAIPCVHTVYNPNVAKVFITLNIEALSDTLLKKITIPHLTGDGGDKNPGSKFPAVLNIQVETGKYDKGVGAEIPFKTYTFRIVALIEGQTLVDLGNPDSASGPNNNDYVVNLDRRESLNIPFELPEVLIKENQELSEDGLTGIEVGTIDQDSVQKRYVKVTKLSYESNSVLLNKIVNLNKVTEIIEVDMPYPFSAIVGTKLDSRAFGNIPKRTYDCKLKLVKVPSNYYPERGRTDKRYWNTVEEFEAAPASSKAVYNGDWDGNFAPVLKWTDNPAWILYDLLTNSRYGMGSHIDESKINKWQLYKIGRFCDAVDDNGYFEGVTDGRGGLEPRFSCNVVFDRGQKLYDAINTIASLFRGRVFFGNSEINFVDDRPRGSINLFTNESVKDGQFYYSNTRRDQQYNTIEVSFRDRFDKFTPKIEVIEDEEDIKERGVFKTTIEGVGITSRAMARRMGQHAIFNTIDENQTVAFTAGLESLLCQPGDLITIEDELKTNKANFGKILAVDLENETIRISNSYISGDMESTLTVYNPTGRDTIEDIDSLNNILRSRYQGFTVTGQVTDAWAAYTGDYGFSGYTSGYDVSLPDTRQLSQQYGLYTGVSGNHAESGKFLYFNTGFTGWTLASGSSPESEPANQRTGAFALGSGDFIASGTGAQTLFSFNTGAITEVDMSITSGRSTTHHFPFSGIDFDSAFGGGHGVLNSEISGSSPNQMAVLSVTGVIVESASDLELSGYNPYGSVLSGFDKPQLLPFIKLGSPAKFEIRDASPFIYKVISMQEEAPNEYLVSATKYDTGKFNLIEKDISIENKADTYSYQVAQTINNVTYETLASPVLEYLSTGVPDSVTDTFTITGRWTDITNSTGFNVRLTHPNGRVTETTVADTGYQFSNLGQVGVYNYCVNALGQKGGKALANFYFDSNYDCSGIFVVYDDLLIFNKSFVNQIAIL